MKAQQISFDFDAPADHPVTTDEQSAHDCFWEIHQYLRDCDCPISWWRWEEKTGRSIWEIN